MPNNDDIWSQLLGAAKKEDDEKKNKASAPEKQPEAAAAEDPWTALLSAAQAQAAPSRKPAENAYEQGSMLLDTYRIESNPMHGGMGSVWRVRHTGWNVDLAMKRPKPEYFASEDSKQGFIDECKNWIDLGLYPNIVSCYYVREIDGIPAIFSEWMENGDLEHHIQKGTLYDGTEEELQARLLDIAIQYARGLHYAHEQGLIHQDVKPANLLLTNDWQAKAADFGLANARAQLTVLEGDPTQQDAGQSLNAAAGGYTPAYCSMEQMDGKTLTRRTDIYSWAVSVMEMYIGARPWQNGVVAGAGCRDYMQAPDCRVKMPEELQELLAKCMEINADDRPHDFAAVEEELKHIYRETLGRGYPRPEPKAAADTAESLNNMALSWLDLGQESRATECWRQAAQKDGRCVPAVYNLALYQYRTGGTDDIGAVSAVRALTIADPDNPDAYMALARIQAECRDPGLPGTLDRIYEMNPEAADDEFFRMRDASEENVVRKVFEYASDKYGPVEISPDGRYLLVHEVEPDEQGSPNSETVAFRDIRDREKICTMKRGREQGPPAEVRIRAAEDPVACIGKYNRDPQVLKWRTSDGKLVQTIVMNKYQREEIVVWDFDGRAEWAIFGSNYGRVAVMHTDTQEHKYLDEISGQYGVTIARNAGKCAVFLPGNGTVAVYGVRDDFRTDIKAENLELCLFVDDDRYLLAVTGGSSPKLRLFDPETGDEEWNIPFPWLDEWNNRQSQHYVCCGGKRVMFRTDSGWAIFSVQGHRWLKTIRQEETQLHVNLVLRAYLPGEGNYVYFSTFTSRLEGFSLPEFTQDSPWMLSVIRTTQAALAEQNEFRKHLEQAEKAAREERTEEALEAIEKASAAGGGKFRSDPALMNLIRRISPGCSIREPGQPFHLDTWPVFSGEVYSMSVSPNGKWIAALSSAGELAVVDTGSGRTVYRDPERRHSHMKKPQWEGDTFFSLVTGRLGEENKKADLGGPGGGKIGIRYKGQDLLASPGGRVYRFDMSRAGDDPNENEALFRKLIPEISEEDVTDILRIPRTSQFLCRRVNGDILAIWETGERKRIQSLGPDSQISGMAVSPKGDLAIARAGDIMSFVPSDESIIFRCDNGTILHSTDTAGSLPVCGFSPNAWYAVIGNEIYDLQTWEMARIDCDDDCFPEFLDNMHLVSLGKNDGLLKVFDCIDGEILRSVSVDEKPASVACSPDRNELYIGNAKGQITHWFWAHQYEV